MSERDQFEEWACKIYDTRLLKGNDGKYLGQVLQQMWEAWQASREALKAEQEGDSDLLASAKKLEREVGDIVDQLKEINSDGFMCAPVAAYPDKLPCPVLLEPGLRFGKGVKTTTMLGALQRRAEYYAEREAMTPEQRAEQDEAMRNFLNLSPIDTTSQQYETLAKGEGK